MATNIKVLASMSITSASTSSSPLSVYPLSGTKSALVTSVSLYNTAPTNTADVFLGIRNGSSTPAYFYKVPALAGNGSQTMNDVVSLRAVDGDAVVAYFTGTGGPINCIVFGIERD